MRGAQRAMQGLSATVLWGEQGGGEGGGEEEERGEE